MQAVSTSSVVSPRLSYYNSRHSSRKRPVTAPLLRELTENRLAPTPCVTYVSLGRRSLAPRTRLKILTVPTGMWPLARIGPNRAIG